MRKLIRNAGLLAALLFGFTQVQAATLTYDFNNSFGDTPADGAPDPWLTAIFDDGGSAGSVTLSVTVGGSVGIAEITELYFNLDPILNPTDLSINYVGGSGPAPLSINQGVDAYKADGDGLYDIFINLPTSTDTFDAGETLVFDIGGIASLTAGDFNYLSFPDGGTGPFLAAAKVQSTGIDGDGSDWIAPVPVPAAVWLFASGLGLLGWLRRKPL